MTVGIDRPMASYKRGASGLPFFVGGRSFRVSVFEPTNKKAVRHAGRLSEATPVSPACRIPGSGCLYVRSLLALGTLGDLETDLLTFLEGFEPTHLDSGKMCKKVFASIIRSDEAITLGIVEPLNSASCHCSCPLNLADMRKFPSMFALQVLILQPRERLPAPELCSGMGLRPPESLNQTQLGF